MCLDAHIIQIIVCGRVSCLLLCASVPVPEHSSAKKLCEWQTFAAFTKPHVRCRCLLSISIQLPGGSWPIYLGACKCRRRRRFRSGCYLFCPLLLWKRIGSTTTCVGAFLVQFVACRVHCACGVICVCKPLRINVRFVIICRQLGANYAARCPRIGRN